MRMLGTRGVTGEDAEEPPGSAPVSLISPVLHGILYYASLAPNRHNPQPGALQLRDRGFSIATAAERSLPKVDPKNREVAGHRRACIRTSCRVRGRQCE